jgi:hypothetical protein
MHGADGPMELNWLATHKSIELGQDFEGHRTKR